METRKDNEKLRYMVRAGMFSALTALMTAVLHIPVGNGYIHCGDAVIFLAALSLPLPYAAGAAAIGGMLADILAGYASYALPTFLIKGMLAVVFSLMCRKQISVKKQIAALIICGLVSVAGYWVTAVVMYGGWAAQFWGTVPGNCIQAAGSGVVYAVLAAAMRNTVGRTMLA